MHFHPQNPLLTSGGASTLKIDQFINLSYNKYMFCFVKIKEQKVHIRV